MVQFTKVSLFILHAYVLLNVCNVSFVLILMLLDKPSTVFPKVYRQFVVCLLLIFGGFVVFFAVWGGGGWGMVSGRVEQSSHIECLLYCVVGVSEPLVLGH